MFVKAKGSKILEYPYEMAHIKRDFKGVMFSGNQPSDKFMERHDIHKVYEDVKPIPESNNPTNLPTYNAITHYIERAKKPKLVDGKWTVRWLKKKKEQRFIDIAIKKEKKIQIDKRNELLNSSDWIVVKSLETNSEVPKEWIEYRQKLRDITEQKGFPLDIDWPTSP